MSGIFNLTTTQDKSWIFDLILGEHKQEFFDGIPVSLFGAGGLGKQLYWTFKLNGFSPAFFYTNDISKNTDLSCGIPIISFDELNKNHPDNFLVIYSATLFKQTDTNNYEWFLDVVFGTNKQKALRGTPVVLFGAGELGQELYWTLKLKGFAPVCFCDNDNSKSGSLCCGIPIISFDELKKTYRDSLIVIASATYMVSITKQLLDNEFSPEQILCKEPDLCRAASLACAKILLDANWKTHALLQAQSAMLTEEEHPTCAAFITKVISALTDGNTPNLSLLGQPLAIIRHNRIISTLHINAVKDMWLKKMAFKQGVSRFDIETSSQCNRKCSYCTNRSNDRFSTNKFINEDILEGVLDQLSEIEYDQEINFVGFNEPLMHKSHILNSIERTRVKLPNANLRVYTNGDFLNQKYIHELARAGLNNLNISIHLAPEQSYSDSEMISRILSMSKKIGIDPVLKSFKKNCSVFATFPHPGLQICMLHSDYSKIGYDRGGLLPDVGVRKQRTSACFNPVTQFILGYNGYVMPCCIMVSDDIQHEPYREGMLGKSETIFDIYTNEHFVAWRRSILRLGPKLGPCQTCDFEDETAFALLAKPLNEW